MGDGQGFAGGQSFLRGGHFIMRNHFLSEVFNIFTRVLHDGGQITGIAKLYWGNSIVVLRKDSIDRSGS